jgi:hypothetical protein
MKAHRSSEFQHILTSEIKFGLNRENGDINNEEHISKFLGGKPGEYGHIFNGFMSFFTKWRKAGEGGLGGFPWGPAG